MFDGRWRNGVDRPRPIGQALHRHGITADVLTATGLVSATATGVLVATGHLHWAVVMLIVTGMHDLLDGPVPRPRAPHPSGASTTPSPTAWPRRS